MLRGNWHIAKNIAEPTEKCRLCGAKESEPIPVLEPRRVKGYSVTHAVI
jgi:hypothetical protein